MNLHIEGKQFPYFTRGGEAAFFRGRGLSGQIKIAGI